MAGGGSGVLVPGSIVAGLRVEEPIGAGGMARVYRAYDERLRRRVALKVLDAELASNSDFQRRFLRESRAAAAVENPHIIPVYDAGDVNGVPYISMRYVSGGDLRSLVARKGPLPAATVASLVGQIASALDAAHRAQIIHRDVKPANMLIDTAAGEASGHMYLSDFGLSKPSLVTFQLTGAGQLLGTLDYVAPEQVMSRDIDGRADQYALACAAFELLTGLPPFGKLKGMAVLRAHLTESPPKVAQRRAELGSAADSVLTRALAKEPAARYPTCREFASQLAAALTSSAGRAGTRVRPAEPPSGRQALTPRLPTPPEVVAGPHAPPTQRMPISPLPRAADPAARRTPAGPADRPIPADSPGPPTPADAHTERRRAVYDAPTVAATSNPAISGHDGPLQANPAGPTPPVAATRRRADPRPTIRLDDGSGG